MDKKLSLIDEANKIIRDFENKEKQKQSYNVATDIYKKNNEFYLQNKDSNKEIIINHNEVVKAYNKIVDRFFYLSVTIFAVTAIMILIKIFI